MEKTRLKAKMNKLKKITLMFIIMSNIMLNTGCWNYREIDKLAIVAGVAVDKGLNGNYKLTIEIVQIGAGKEAKITSKLITTEGKTIFDTVRNGISISGKKLYWSHAKAIIISKEVAKDSVIKVIDWFNRDSETRSDVNLFISKEKSAADILKCQGTTEEIISFELDEMIENHKNLSKAPKKELWDMINELESEGVSPTVPSVGIKEVEGKKKPSILGTAILKKDRLIGFLSGEDTKKYLFATNEIKGGTITVNGHDDNGKTSVSLEIFKNKTKIEPVINGNTIKMNISIETIVAIDEIQGTEDVIEDKKLRKLQNDTEKMLKNDVEGIIEKVQSQYGVDIFGFGEVVRENKNKKWIEVGKNWSDEFKNLKVTVKSKVNIRNSAMMSKPLRIGE